MLPQRLARLPTRQLGLAASRRLTPRVQQRTFIPESINGPAVVNRHFPDPPSLTDDEDPAMNGSFPMPPPVKRQFRDPYGDWWDKQERRNYNEPVHEDYDQLGLFTPYEYTWTTTGKGLFQIGAFVATFLSVCWVVKATYPERKAVPRTYDDGLLKELGGPGAVLARMEDEE